MLENHLRTEFMNKQKTLRNLETGREMLSIRVVGFMYSNISNSLYVKAIVYSKKNLQRI